MAFLEPGHVMDRGVGSGLDAAVVAVDGLMAADFCILEAIGLLFGGEQFDILAKSPLIAFDPTLTPSKTKSFGIR